jgi:NADPH2:quinone reductase
MRAISIRKPGGPDMLEWIGFPDPVPGDGEVLIDVVASAINRADLLQRQGLYPPPKGASKILGLECSGTIAALGPDVTDWKIGDEVCALLSGGGYADQVAVPAAQVLPVPRGVDLMSAAALPEVACTVWSNVVMLGNLTEGELLLIHGGAGGIGTHAIQVGKALGATVAATAGSADRVARCRQLGADIAIDYHDDDFGAALLAASGGRGADVILDNMGASYLARNIAALADSGRLLVIGLQGGRKAELDIAALLGKRAMVAATSLRGRPVDGPNGKGRIVSEVRQKLWPLVESGKVAPVVYDSVPIQRAGDAHRLLESGVAFGKVILQVKAV